MLVSAGSLGGSLLAGAASVRVSSRLVLMVALLATAVAVAALAASPPPAAALALVAVCGLAYGALITAIPNLVDESFPAAIAFRLFSLVFTAWGIGGIAGPVAAGAAFERFGSYAPGLAAAAVLALGGAWLLRRM
jgi:MFS family permease